VSINDLRDLRDGDRLVFGGSGAVGRFLLRRLQQQARDAWVLSRAATPSWAHDWEPLRWCRGALESLPPLPAPRMVQVLSAGPLDALADWLPRAGLAPGSRVVALSSMSVEWKRDSPNPDERALAARLVAAESAVAEAAAAAGIELVLLRPTLIWGAGIDHSLTPLLQRARRWGWLPWPRFARGLRQPVHADDVAAALLAACNVPPPSSPLALPGAESLPFDAAVDRLLRLVPGARRLSLPLPRLGLRRLACRGGRVGALAAVLWRSAQDQTAEPAGWGRLGLAPRGFDPRAEDFRPW
jgi:nucleoside-diphosphate-sugar epimerase